MNHLNVAISREEGSSSCPGQCVCTHALGAAPGESYGNPRRRIEAFGIRCGNHARSESDAEGMAITRSASVNHKPLLWYGFVFLIASPLTSLAGGALFLRSKT